MTSSVGYTLQSGVQFGNKHVTLQQYSEYTWLPTICQNAMDWT